MNQISDQYFCCARIVILRQEPDTQKNPATGDDLTTMNYFLKVMEMLLKEPDSDKWGEC